mmetsp:Transcript_10104/g.24416  ORF Transcript_10104/g.24416 Transcript_10104/m.24416 type:complete len:249 (-) Transcript_10104:1641-2387(-)
MMLPRRKIKLLAGDCQEAGQGFQGALRGLLEQSGCARGKNFRSDHLLHKKLANEAYVAHHPKAIPLPLLLVLLQLLWGCRCLLLWRHLLRRVREVRLERSLTLIEKDVLELADLQVLRTPVVEVHTEAGVHFHEVMLRGGLFKDLLHEDPDVVFLGDAALSELPVKVIELLEGELVQNALHSAGNLLVGGVAAATFGGVGLLTTFLLNLRPRIVRDLQLDRLSIEIVVVISVIPTSPAGLSVGTFLAT